MINKTSLFVYGSFCQGMVHFNKLESYIQFAEPAVAKGSVYRLPVGYPVFCDEGDCQISGQLIEIEAPALLMTLLDEFHGFMPMKPEKSLFFRKSIEVLRVDGGTVEASVYSVNKAKLPREARAIDGGDWMADINAEPPLTGRLTEQQISYVKKLGSSTGRDIVPIDLEIYRQLMKFELIVDKGRRLALSKLGKDVYKYLS